MNDSLFHVNVPVYEGPMDLLLFVVRQRQVEVDELPLALIAGDFLDYARSVEGIDLDAAGEIIYIASELIRMKIRSLLPREEDLEAGIEDETDSVRDEELEEIYRQVVAAARKLAENEKIQREHFPRGEAAANIELDATGELLRDVSLVDLAAAFREVTRRMDSTPVHQLALFKVTIEDQAGLILAALRNRQRVSFYELAENFNDRIEAVLAFLAMLELIRRGRVIAQQDGLFREVWIERGPHYDTRVPEISDMYGLRPLSEDDKGEKS